MAAVDRGPELGATKARHTVSLSLTINGKPWSGDVPVEEPLLEFLRVRLRLTGTKRSCESEVCGACTVLVDNRPVSACNYLAFEADGQSVLTIEGLARDDVLDPLQEAFVRNIGAQCGYCTPGQIMAAKALLMENSNPTRDQIAEWLTGNICRCGAYGAIAQSILEAAEEYQKRKGQPVHEAGRHLSVDEVSDTASLHEAQKKSQA
jgi:carbon-monoxide dehydrogenase small subunit